LCQAPIDRIDLEKDRVGVCAALSIGHYETSSLRFNRPYVLRVVSSLRANDTPEARRHEAERYLQATPPKALFEDIADKMAASLPQDQRDQFKRMMTTQLDIAALTKAMTDAMVKHFTTEELKALADFYGSAVGKSAMQKFGAYMADIMPTMQAEIMKAQAKLNQSLPNNRRAETDKLCFRR
jgi:hypothetical protein